LSAAVDELRIDSSSSGVSFWIHVSPGARKQRIGGVHGDALRVAVSAPPVEGRANAACVQLLAKALDEPAASIELNPSSRGRRKRVAVRGNPETLGERLRALAATDRLR
jgi:uncharacterized protein (TIGR00251 family)